MLHWKNKEVQLTAWLDNLHMWPAVRMSRALRGERVEDIAWGPLSVELKTRANTPPGYMLDWLKQADTNADDKVPVVIIHKDGMLMGKQLVILTLNDFVLLLGSMQTGRCTHDNPDL
jgi:hypothetical protein